MADKLTHETERQRQLQQLLDGAAGEIRRAKLDGLGLAYAGNVYGGLLTLSRSIHAKAPSGAEVSRLLREFKEAAEAAGRPVLALKEIERGRVVLENGRYHVIRYSVYFGEQGRLFDE
jgi:hypothetical protein